MKKRGRYQVVYLLDRDDHRCGIHLGGCGKIVDDDDYSKDHVIPKSVFVVDSFREVKYLTPKDRALFRQFAFQPMHKDCNRRKDACFPPISTTDGVIDSRCSCCAWVFTEADGSIFNGVFFNGKKVDILRQYEGGRAAVKPVHSVTGTVSPLGVGKNPDALILKFHDKEGRLVSGPDTRKGGLVTRDVIERTNRGYPGCSQCSGGRLSSCVRCGTSRIMERDALPEFLERKLMIVGNRKKWQNILYPCSDN